MKESTPIAVINCEVKATPPKFQNGPNDTWDIIATDKSSTEKSIKEIQFQNHLIVILQLLLI